MKIRNFFKSIFRLNTWKRIFVALFSASLLSIGIGFVANYYIAQNINRSIEYGGGAEVLVQVKTLDEKVPNNNIVKQADSAIFQRLTGGASLNGTSVFTEGGGRIRISRNKISDNRELNDFINEIVTKPLLVVTDTNNKPLFYDGVFNPNISLKDGDETNWLVPFAPDSAISQTDPNQPQANQVRISLKDKQAQLEWTKATEYVSKKPFGQNRIRIWSNISELINLAKTKFPNEWQNSGENIYNFIHVGESVQPTPLGQNRFLQPKLKEFQFDAKKYLISEATVSSPLNGSSFVISGNFSSQEAKQLALNINYGIADYKLDFLSASFVSKSKSDYAFLAGWIAIGISLVMIAIFMIVNYGVLGVVSTISLALYVFLTLLFFTIVRGEYSPITISALVIGIGMNVDANVISFEIFKNKVYSGQSVLKANNQANKLSLKTIIDSNVTTLIAALVLFYFGTKSIKGFSITLIFSIIFTLIVTVAFTKFFVNFILKIPFLQTKPQLLGVKSKYIQKYSRGYQSIFSKTDYFKIYKYSKWAPLIILGTAIIVFIAFAASYKNPASGLNLSIDFSSGTSLTISNNDQNFDLIDAKKGQQIIDYLNTQGLNSSNSQILLKPLNEQSSLYNIEIRTQSDITNQLRQITNNLTNNFSNLEITTYSISNEEAKKLVENAVVSIAIALLFVTIFTLLRFKWSYSLSIILSLLFNIAMIFLLMIIARIQFSPTAIIAFLTLIGYTVNDTIVIFDKIKNIFKEIPHNDIYTPEKIRQVAHKAVKDAIKRSLLTSLTTLFTIIILLIFYQSIDIIFSITMLIGVLIGSYSSLFIATNLWIRFEIIRNRRKQKRIDSRFWGVQKVYEQTFANINDFEK
ncbi:protein translocase subunit SecDF [Mesomycoplasma conjunctivae]|uniref:protein translocase subunit SecDF n=1 Tax=Mesomycoplasma conjunctivae TaxID=45361 RepID=UPI003DA5BD8D